MNVLPAERQPVEHRRLRTAASLVGLLPLGPLVGTLSLSLASDRSRAARILLVEDDLLLRETVSEALREDGHVVLASGRPNAALAQAREFRPDLAIVDLMLPHMTGEEFCDAIRRIHELRELAIIVVSASRTAPEVGERIGALATIRKPFDLFELLERVSSFLAD
jgi:DNA-binding response OmpR family regulator